MNDEILGRYLRHHLTGSEAALGLAREMGHDDGELGEYLARFVEELHEERTFLSEAIDAVPSARQPMVAVVLRPLVAAGSFVRRAVSVEHLSTIEGLEALAVGVWGKRLLWGALARVAERDVRFSPASDRIAQLAERAEAQERELLRLRDDALSPSSRRG